MKPGASINGASTGKSPLCPGGKPASARVQSDFVGNR